MILLVNTSTGLPAMIAETDYAGVYVDNEQRGEDTVHIVDTAENPSVIFSTWHWNGIAFGQHIPNTNPEYIWDSSLFTYKAPENYLEIIRPRKILEIKMIATDKTLARYPIHKQLNIGRDPTSLEAIEMYAFIDGIRDSSNIAEDAISTALTIEEIESIVDAFRLL